MAKRENKDLLAHYPITVRTSTEGDLALEIPEFWLSDDKADMLKVCLPEALILFLQKSHDYQSDGFHTANLLGARGQFADIWRKIGKLYRTLWNGEESNFETSKEIVQDLFGHVLLTLDYLHKDEVNAIRASYSVKDL